MTRPVILRQLRTALEREADLPVLTDTTVVTLTEARDYINDAIHELTGILAECYPAGYFDVTAPLDTTAGISTVDLPANFYQLRRIAHQVGDTLYPLCEWQENRASSSVAPRGWAAGSVIRYRLKADALELDPVPNAVYRLSLDYVPVLADLVEDFDEFDGRIAWDRWVVLSAAIRVMDRLEQDASQKRAILAEVERRIRFHAPARDKARIATVRNLYDALPDNDTEGEYR